MERHNGWRNFETWQAALWLDNDGTLEMLRQDGMLTEEAITEQLESLLDNIPPSLLGDIVSSWLNQVDVCEIFNKAAMESYQIGYYRLPFDERVTPEDHTPELDFGHSLEFCLDRINELKAAGYYNISLDELYDGAVVRSERIEDYIEGWAA